MIGQLAHADAGGVGDGVCYRCGYAAEAEFAHALAYVGDDIGSWFVQEDHILVRDVSVNGHFITCQVMVDEKAVALKRPIPPSAHHRRPWSWRQSLGCAQTWGSGCGLHHKRRACAERGQRQ